uniref:Uncharacterized protein n=1 Tax=Aegilops tauschii subsp. strangulata TaxID=200361 RepID=A0A453QR02_AEGTS
MLEPSKVKTEAEECDTYEETGEEPVAMIEESPPDIGQDGRCGAVPLHGPIGKAATRASRGRRRELSSRGSRMRTRSMWSSVPPPSQAAMIEGKEVSSATCPSSPRTSARTTFPSSLLDPQVHLSLSLSIWECFEVEQQTLMIWVGVQGEADLVKLSKLHQSYHSQRQGCKASWDHNNV